MAVLDRVMFNIVSRDVPGSVAFYRELFGLESSYESDWIVIMSPPGKPGTHVAIVDERSQFTPRHAWGSHGGIYLTFVVENVFETIEKARRLGVEVVAEPVALDYGQTRGLIRDFNGMVIDISTPTDDLPEDLVATLPHRSTAIDQEQPDDLRPL